MDTTLSLILQILTILSPIVLGLIGLRKIRLLKVDVDNNTEITKKNAVLTEENTVLTKHVEEKVVHIDANQQHLEKAQAELHQQINGKMEKVIELAERANFAEGKLEAGKELQSTIPQVIADAHAKGKAEGKQEEKLASVVVPIPHPIPQLTPDEHTIKVEIVKIPKLPKEDVEVAVKSQTDSIKDELIKTTQLLGEALGKAAGKAEQKKETDEDKLNAPPDKPIDVKVTNEPLITKVVTPDTKKKE